MTTSREQLILAEVETRLKGAPLGPHPMPAGLTVDRYRTLELKPANLPHISIYTVTATSDSIGGGSETQTEVKLAHWAKPGAGESVDQALDPLWLWSTQQLLTDQSLGGLARRVAPASRVWSAAIPQAQPFGDLDAHFLITHRHMAADPSQPY
jgi:hypothetical protein